MQTPSVVGTRKNRRKGGGGKKKKKRKNKGANNDNNNNNNDGQLPIPPLHLSGSDSRIDISTKKQDFDPRHHNLARSSPSATTPSSHPDTEEEDVETEFEIPETEDEGESNPGSRIRLATRLDLSGYDNDTQDLYEVINLGALVRNKLSQKSGSKRDLGSLSDAPQEFVVKEQRNGAYYYVVTDDSKEDSNDGEESKDANDDDDDTENEQATADVLVLGPVIGYEEKLHEDLGFAPDKEKEAQQQISPQTNTARGTIYESQASDEGVSYEVVPSYALVDKKSPTATTVQPSVPKQPTAGEETSHPSTTTPRRRNSDHQRRPEEGHTPLHHFYPSLLISHLLIFAKQKRFSGMLTFNRL